MKRFVRRLAVIAVGLGMATPALAQDPMQDVTIEATYVNENIYMLTGQGGNIGLSVGTDGPFIIDDQFAPLTEKIKIAIAAVTEGDVRFVLNTHWHFDHTGGNENFGEAGALIVAHENVRKRMTTEQFLEAFDMRIPPSPKVALPVITFTDAATFYWNGETIRALHVEDAHTDGDAIIHFESANVFHMGDTFFNGIYPFIDAGSGGSIHGVIAAVDRVLEMTTIGTKIIPGHGPLADPDDLRTYRAMLVTVRDRLQTMIADGKTDEQIVAAKPTADLDADWGGGSFEPDQWVGIVLAGMRQN